MNLRSRVAFVGWIIVVAVSLGCSGARRTPSSDTTDASVDSMGVAPTDTTTVPIRTTRNVRESSALAMSLEQAGVMFTINDSGNDPILFAFDTTGADRGAWAVNDAKNVDWEALAIGPCGKQKTPHCVYIGDVGDNDAHHPTRTIYRVAEPTARDSSFTGAAAAEHVTFTYADQPHDVEAMYVAKNGDVFVITKRPLHTTAGQLRPALVFRIPANAWTAKQEVTAALVDSLSIIPGSSPLRTITDVSLSPDGSHLAVRTYSQLFVYATDPTTGRVDRAQSPAICDLVSLGEAQGEGLTWTNTIGRFAFSSEGRAAPLHLATCPLAK